jgi:hypothetical protein
VFYIDNVAKYIADSGGVSIASLPQVVPPFKHVWAEFACPDPEGNGVYRCGMYFQTVKIDDQLRDKTVEQVARARANNANYARWTDEEVETFGWMSLVTVFGGSLKSTEEPLQLIINRDGSCRGMVTPGGEKKVLSEAVGHALFAFGLAHCKNVRHVEHVPGGKFERAKRRRGEEPSLRYYTLEIDPMKQVLRTEGNADSTGLKQALHICRGHFKDYRQSGLFGRIKGIFWWDSMARGSSSQGVVAKDYAVGELPDPKDAQ